jgi:hypothetical protein
MYNHTLTNLVLDGNILGHVGTQSLIACIQRAAGEHRNLTISFDYCDCETDDIKVFNAANPAGIWRLDLSEPYGQMVVEECIFLANHKAGCSIKWIDYIPPGGSSRIPVELFHSESTAHNLKNKFDEIEFRLKSKSFCSSLANSEFDEAASIMVTLLKMFNFILKPQLVLSIVIQVKHGWDAKVKSGLVLYEDLAGSLIFEIFEALFLIAGFF